MSLFSQVPAIRAAIEEENRNRDLAFTEAPALICGVTVLPLTLRRYLILCASGNAFVCGGPITPVEASKFLWCLSAGYNPEQRGAEEFVAAIAGKNYGEVLAGISDLLAFSFFDAPAGGNDDTGENRSYYSFAAVYLDVMGREYGWTFRDVMDCPLPVLFQLIKAIKNRNGGIMFNPLSDRAIQEHVRTLNQ